MTEPTREPRCNVQCEACLRHDWDFFHVPEKHFTGGTPDCVLNLGDGPTYDGVRCICGDISK
jgi:hypothetical protein